MHFTLRILFFFLFLFVFFSSLLSQRPNSVVFFFNDFGVVRTKQLIHPHTWLKTYMLFYLFIYLPSINIKNINCFCYFSCSPIDIKKTEPRKLWHFTKQTIVLDIYLDFSWRWTVNKQKQKKLEIKSFFLPMAFYNISSI